LIAVGCWGLGPDHVDAQSIQMQDGRVLRGKMMRTSGVIDRYDDLPKAGDDPKAMPILVINDDLRRTFVSKHHVVTVLDEAPEKIVRIKLWQKVAKSGNAISSVGPSLGISPFDEYGRRVYNMQTRDGPLAVVQGITELTHRYAKVESLIGPKRRTVWDMRLATSSIPGATLQRILDKAASQDKAEDRLQVVRFYLQGERYKQARRELNDIISRFPGKQGLEAQARQLKQRGASRVLREIELRHASGQHELVSGMLLGFPAEDVAGETLQQVREMGAKYERNQAHIAQVGEQLQTAAAGISDIDDRRLIESVLEEISTELSHNTIDRLVPFAQLHDDDSLSAEQKSALAITGWLLGGENATPELSLAVSLLTIREAVFKYLREPMVLQRELLLESVRSLEGASVKNVAELIAHITPPWEIPQEADRKFGAYELHAPGRTEHGDFRYLVQLPPEYDPYRHYPTILALNGAYNTPLQELDFWAGPQRRDEEGEVTGPRNGQAMRHGYITIAIDWQKPQQYEYEYSLREHEAVLTCLRDANRRFGIDTDRIYLTGHGIGGDATWDFALAHPDMWAGVIPFVARAHKYIPHYWDNAEYVPLYFVAGELDGISMAENATVLNKYFKVAKKDRFDTTVVEFLGRGHEPFHDEILRLFDWMGRRSRNPAPQEFTCKTMRPWDNYFWWIEGRGFPKPVFPQSWPQAGARPTEIRGRQLKKNTLSVRCASEQITLWLGPELVDFSQPINITLNGRRLGKARSSIKPDLEVLLEDVRTRAERLRPFWAKLESP
jgi:predicted esterase